MSDSTTKLDTISASQSQKEVTANALLDAGSNALLFGRRATNTAGLTWGYYGGVYRKSDGTLLDIPKDNTIALTASQTNYLLETNGVVSKVTVAPAGWPGPLAGGANALYEIKCDAIGVNPAAWPAGGYKDYRAAMNPSSGAPAETAATIGTLIAGATADTPTDSDAFGFSDAEESNILNKITWANIKATLKTYFDTIYAPLAQPYIVSAFFPGAPTASAVVFYVPIAVDTTFPDDFAGSFAKSKVAATASTAFDVKANGSSVGTITFAAGATSATFVTAGGAVVVTAGQTLEIVAPGTADASLANIGFALKGTR